jgi:hypothetical protein
MRKTHMTLLTDVKPAALKAKKPTRAQLTYLQHGLFEAGGKLPLFDHKGQRCNERTIRTCIEQGWAEPWFNNPLKPDWLVCKLTCQGRALFP